MNALRRVTTSAARLSCMHTTQRSFVKVGETVPVNYVKDEKAPVILEDKEYPEWLFSVGKKELTLGELIERVERVGPENVTTSFSIYEVKRFKRLLTLDQIKESNAEKGKAASA